MKQLRECPVCGSRSISLFYLHRQPQVVKSWQVFRCEACTLGFLHPQLSWQELAPYYSDNYAAYDELHGAQEDLEQAVARSRSAGEFRHVPMREGMRLLDVGCGGGYFLRVAARLGAKVEGIEPSQVGAARAGADGIPIFRGTIEQYVDQNASRCFDMITAIHVLEHMPDPVSSLSMVRRLLAPDGVMTVIVPNAGCWASRRLQGHWHSADLPRHLMHFTIASLRECAARAGLECQACFTYSLPHSVASSLRLWLRHRCLVPRRLTGRVRLLEQRLAPAFGRYLDRRGTGESIIMRLCRAATVPCPA